MVDFIRGGSGVGGFQGVTRPCVYLLALAALLVLFAYYGQCSFFVIITVNLVSRKSEISH